MNCRARAMSGVTHRGGYDRVNHALSCGGGESWSHLRNLCHRPKAVVNRTVKTYPMVCEPPERITIDRVTTLAGIDNALFLIGDVRNYRMNEDFNVVVSDDVIGVQSFNMPSYLLLKAGDLHTLAVSTADIQNHPVSAFLRGNQHLFGHSSRHVDLFELAPQDFHVEANEEHGHCGPPPREPVIRVIDPTSLNSRYITIEVSWYECQVFVYREIFYIIPVICPNGSTAKGANWANWADNILTCGEKIRIPGSSTDNGQFVIADKPVCGCPPFRRIPFGGFGW